MLCPGHSTGPKEWLPYLQSKHVIERDLFLKVNDVSELSYNIILAYSYATFISLALL